MQAIRRAAEAVEVLATTASDELPTTMAAVRLSGMEISDLTMELSDLRSAAVHVACVQFQHSDTCIIGPEIPSWSQLVVYSDTVPLDEVVNVLVLSGLGSATILFSNSLYVATHMQSGRDAYKNWRGVITLGMWLELVQQEFGQVLREA